MTECRLPPGWHRAEHGRLCAAGRRRTIDAPSVLEPNPSSERRTDARGENLLGPIAAGPKALARLARLSEGTEVLWFCAGADVLCICAGEGPNGLLNLTCFL